ncbi:hypothetical protein A2Y99_04855 [Candidatus Gottesmanbacteria bacterium RBG_13_37_7]|uniref:Uncharacterized protein n=1 Tax=Candidatus Gottesmanbacteria bacterium RBG_13_37_7 TaxID=1798369 RepID=A0A1F5YJ02_9BACT|nr:MAG: hypothetical protein A2Y99_04855 [Candidatus Gottesmanbacteria bacterium RBG_13_37_7]
MTKKDMKNFPPELIGFLQAMGVTFYCSFVGVIFWKGNEIFGKNDRYVGPVTFLLLFISSAMVCALIVFYKPYLLFFKGKKKEAIETVVHTAIWLFIAFILFLITMYIR